MAVEQTWKSQWDADVWGKSTSGKRDSVGKGLKVKMCDLWKEAEEATVIGTEYARKV